MIRYNYCKQGTDEWHKLRKPLTASNALIIANNGKGLETLIKNFYNPKPIQSNYWCDRGLELEPKARAKYEWEKSTLIREVGTVTNSKYKQCSCSPDGLTDKGLIEIKCLKLENYLDFRFNQKIPKKYLYQMQMQIMITEREYCDFVMYHPEQPLLIVKVEPNKKIIAEIELGIKSGLRILKK